MVTRKKPRILIADHDQTFLDQLADRVLQLEMSVDFAEDAYTAIDLINAERYDLIVLEVGMPIHNGLEILAIAKEAQPDVPVLMIAFTSTKDWAEQALNEGAYTYLLRPLESIEMFDMVLMEGLGTNGATHPAPKTRNDFYLAAMKLETDREPNPFTANPDPPDWIKEVQLDKPAFASASPETAPKMESLGNRGKAFTKDRKQRLEEVFASLPDGVIELNMQGQILACNNIARDRLVLEAESNDKPISQFIRSIGSRQITETKRIDLAGHNAQLIVKPITDSNGEMRTVVVIREMVEDRKVIQPTKVKATANVATQKRSKVEFKNVNRRTVDEYPEEGFSLMLMWDKAKEVVKSEVDRFLTNSPAEWLSELVSGEPEDIEVDPEMLTAVHRRLSKINSGM